MHGINYSMIALAFFDDFTLKVDEHTLTMMEIYLMGVRRNHNLTYSGFIFYIHARENLLR